MSLSPIKEPISPVRNSRLTKSNVNDPKANIKQSEYIKVNPTNKQLLFQKEQSTNPLKLTKIQMDSEDS